MEIPYLEIIKAFVIFLIVLISVCGIVAPYLSAGRRH